MTAAASFDSPLQPPPPVLVEQDIPCRNCAYNLRGLSSDGRCPECGAAVGLSLHGDLLRYSNPAWLEKLGQGLTLIIVGIFVIFFGALLGGAAGAIFQGDPAVMLFVAAVGIAGYLLHLAGTWFLTMPDPSGLGEDQYGTSRKIIRISLLVGIVDQFRQLLQPELTLDSQAELLETAGTVFGFIAAIFGVIALFATLNYLRKLALRIPDLKLSNRARFLAYAFGISYGLLVLLAAALALIVFSYNNPQRDTALVAFLGIAMMVVFLAVVVFAILYLILLFKFRRSFGDLARISRQTTWAEPPGA